LGLFKLGEKMKKFTTAILLALSLCSIPAIAGWGAVACDNKGSGACGASSGYDTWDQAYIAAINACQSSGYTCYIAAWEHNSCCYGYNGSYACN
jgi:hypothetical protein